MAIKIYAGVDAGGSTTRAVVAALDEGGRLVNFAEAESGPGNTNADGSVAVFNMRQVIMAAANKAQLPTSFEAIFLGVAGVNCLADKADVETMVRQNLAGVEFNQLQVENDTLALQAAAFNGGPGIVLIGGTGSNCCAIDVNGQVQVAGGQDFIWGDPGSAYHIGYLAIERVMAALDGREVAAPKLTQLVLDYMKINPAAVDVYGQMSKWTYRDRKIKERISALASLVANLANDGDVEARAIFYASMAAAVEFVQAVVRRAGFSAHGLRIGITGGAITGQPGRRILDELLQVALPGTTTFIPQLPPAVGALWRALQMSDVPVTEKIIASLATALTAAPILQTPPRRSTL